MKNYFGTEDFKGIWSDKKIKYHKRPTEGWQGMPVGTGKTGAMIWSPDGLCVQISHTGCWDTGGDLPSLLRFMINISGNPFTTAKDYYQELDTREGKVVIKAQTEDGDVFVEARAHPVLDVITIDIRDERNQPGVVEVLPVLWRQNTSWNTTDDMLFYGESNSYSAFHELNSRSGVEESLEVPLEDPLKGLTCGTAIWMKGIEKQDLYGGFMRETVPSKRKTIFIAASAGKMSRSELAEELKERLCRARSLSEEEYRSTHGNWWKTFWDRSFLEVDENSRLQPLRAVWHLNRYFAAASMAGKYVPKFNGSIFLYEYDQRAWGGAYWFQNTRLQYWPLFKTGDIDYLKPFFDMYWNALNFSKKRVLSVYGHGGAIFPETMHFWGAARFGDAQRGMGIANNYIKNHFSGSLELIMMMLEYDRYKGEYEFAVEKLLPMSEEIIAFFFEHFPVVKGQLFLSKSAALETWWEADNPADQIAGLRAVLPAVIIVAKRVGYVAAVIKKWICYYEMLPELPKGKMNISDSMWMEPVPGDFLLPADNVHHLKKENWEDPELYAVWPFNLYGINLPGYSTALATFQNRLHKEPCWGWSQTAIWAARLGLDEEAANLLLKHFAYSSNLPGGMMVSPGAELPGRKGIPPQGYLDTIGAIAIAVNEMLLQDHTGELKVLPAWPCNEKVEFKLHAAKGRIVEEEYRPGIK